MNALHCTALDRVLIFLLSVLRFLDRIADLGLSKQHKAFKDFNATENSGGGGGGDEASEKFTMIGGGEAKRMIGGLIDEAVEAFGPGDVTWTAAGGTCQYMARQLVAEHFFQIERTAFCTATVRILMSA